MAAALERESLEKLCTDETYEKARTILQLAKAKTGPGTGFQIAHHNALPGICAYLASEELSNNEVSQKAAVASACISQNDFTKALNTVRKALGPTGRQHTRGLNYRSLISTYCVTPADLALGWMRQVETRVLRNELLPTHHRSSTVTCAIFFWICQIMEVQAVHEKPLCQTHGVPLAAFKSVLKALDNDCDPLTDHIKSQLHSLDTSLKLHARPSASLQKSPSKSAMKTKSQELTPVKPLALKRAVVFSQDDPDDISLPETPSKRRRVESPFKHSPSVPRTRRAQCTTSSTTAFEQAMKGVSTLHRERQSLAPSIDGSHLPLPGPSTPRRARIHSSNEESNAMEVDEHQREIAEHPVRKRFRPVFLDRHQWRSQDPKLGKTWDAAIEHRVQMMELYAHPFEQHRPIT